MADVLIVEDQPAVATALRMVCDLNDIASSVARGPDEALAILDSRAAAGRPVGLVVQDMNFAPKETSGAEGIELFRTIRRRDPELPVLLLTAWTSLETAVALVKEGASDYVAKPWDDDKLVATMRRLLRRRRLQLEDRRSREAAQAARAELAERADLCGAVFLSTAMTDAVALAVQVASSTAPVLITGPSGVGKEKLAEIVQANSPRQGAAFVRVNAAALPDELLEAELFGAEAGAFTGARRRRLGRFEAADGGTLFLDEIGNLSPGGQAKLLRVLQTGTFERLGSSASQQVDVRPLFATNADLPARIAAGSFREDLYFRLNVIEITLPPLAERSDDILPLAEHFLGRHRAPAGASWELSSASRAALLAHPWPGNVRELENALTRAALTASSHVLEPTDLGLTPLEDGPRRHGLDADEPPSAERLAVERALEAAHGVVARAAERLGISRQALYRRMEKYGVEVERRLKK